MGTFVETAIVDYRLSFADNGKQTFLFLFHLQQTNRSLLFLFSVAIKERKLPFPLVPFSVYLYFNTYTCIYIHILPFKMEIRIPGDFPDSIEGLLIMQADICCLSVC